MRPRFQAIGDTVDPKLDSQRPPEYEPPRVEDLPAADGPVVTAAGDGSPLPPK